MTILYYQQDYHGHLAGDYACTVSDDEVGDYLERYPLLFCYIENDTAEITGLAYMGIDIAVGGTD